MIHMPRRSVTRFFIPLIDVMILLFCIFLLLPIFKEGDPEHPDKQLKKKFQQQEEELRKLYAEQAEQRKGEKPKLSKLFAVRVLEIEPSKTRPGRSDLFYYEKGKAAPEVIDSEAALGQLVQRHQKELVRKYLPEERPELNYLILWPRENPLYPLEIEKKSYEQWLNARKVKFTLDRRTGDGS